MSIFEAVDLEGLPRDTGPLLADGRHAKLPARRHSLKHREFVRYDSVRMADRSG
jgi:hypothetical protein